MAIDSHIPREREKSPRIDTGTGNDLLWEPAELRSSLALVESRRAGVFGSDQTGRRRGISCSTAATLKNYYAENDGYGAEDMWTSTGAIRQNSLSLTVISK